MDTNTPAAVQKPQFMGAFDLFKPSIEIIKLNLTSFVALALIPLAGFVVAAILLMVFSFSDSQSVNTIGAVLGVVVAITAGVGMLLTSPGYVVIQVKGAKGEKIAPMAAFKEGLKHFWPFIGLSILQTLIFLAGIVALIIPFFFLYRRYVLAQYYLIDRNMGVMDSLRQSAKDSITYKSPMWGLVGVYALLSVIGGIPMVAFVAWIPQLLYSCAPAYRFKEVTDASVLAAKKEVSPHESLKEVL